MKFWKAKPHVSVSHRSAGRGHEARMQAALIKHINAPIASKLGLINAFSGIFGCLAQGAGAGALSAVLRPASASASAGRASLHRVRSSDPGYSRARGDGRRLRCSGSDLRPAISSLPHLCCNCTVASSRKLLLSTVTMRAGGRLRVQGCG